MRNCKKENSNSPKERQAQASSKQQTLTNKVIPLQYQPAVMDERMYLLQKKKQEAEDVSIDFEKFRKEYMYNSYKASIKTSMKINKISQEAQ